MVASLIDKAPNLAGLARTCEVRTAAGRACQARTWLQRALDPSDAVQVFGAAALVVADLRVVKEHQFRAISMTAEQWVPMLEVPEEALLAWLLQQRRTAGYRLVGLEQVLSEQLSLAHCGSVACQAHCVSARHPAALCADGGVCAAAGLQVAQAHRPRPGPRAHRHPLEHTAGAGPARLPVACLYFIV